MDRGKETTNLKKDRQLLEDIQAGKPLPPLEPKTCKYIRSSSFDEEGNDKIGTLPVLNYAMLDTYAYETEKDKLGIAPVSYCFEQDNPAKKRKRSLLNFLITLIEVPIYLILGILVFLVSPFTRAYRRLRGEEKPKVKLEQENKLGINRGYQHRM